MKVSDYKGFGNKGFGNKGFGNKVSVLAVSFALSVTLFSGCKKPEDAASTTTTTTTATTTASTATKPGEMKDDTLLENGMIAKVEMARKKIKMGAMPDSTEILSVAGTPITIGQYRRQLKTQEEQIQVSLSADHELQSQLLEDARKNNVTLTPEERKGLLDTAKKAETAGAGVVKKHLDAMHETTDQFNKYVLDMGLAFKAATKHVEKNLLHQMVDREILCAAAKTNRMEPGAFNVYLEAKKNKKMWDELLKSGLTADQLRDEIIQTELCKNMAQKIRKDTKVTDVDVQKFYDENKDKFKHGDMIRLSQIVVAAPSKDLGQQESMSTQIKKQNPSLSPAELEQQVKVVQQQKKQKAEELLARALKGEDFAKLANQESDDIPARAAKTGGDMGMQPREHLLKEFADKVMPLKAGTIYPSVIPSVYGYHIIKVTEKKPAGITPLADVKANLTELLKQNKEESAMRAWLLDKRRTTEITLSPEFKTLADADSGKTNTH